VTEAILIKSRVEYTFTHWIHTNYLLLNIGFEITVYNAALAVMFSHHYKPLITVVFPIKTT